MVEYTCNVCGSRIGGVNHTLRHDNRQARRLVQYGISYTILYADKRGDSLNHLSRQHLYH